MDDWDAVCLSHTHTVPIMAFIFTGIWVAWFVVLGTNHLRGMHPHTIHVHISLNWFWWRRCGLVWHTECVDSWWKCRDIDARFVFSQGQPHGYLTANPVSHCAAGNVASHTQVNVLRHRSNTHHINFSGECGLWWLNKGPWFVPPSMWERVSITQPYHLIQIEVQRYVMVSTTLDMCDQLIPVKQSSPIHAHKTATPCDHIVKSSSFQHSSPAGRFFSQYWIQS